MYPYSLVNTNAAQVLPPQPQAILPSLPRAYSYSPYFSGKQDQAAGKEKPAHRTLFMVA